MVVVVVVVGRWSDGVQGLPHFWLRARGAARGRCGVIILRIWESLLYGTAHFFVCARAVFFCLRARGIFLFARAWWRRSHFCVRVARRWCGG